MAAENYSRRVAVMTVLVVVVKRSMVEMKVVEINDRCFRWFFFFRSFSLFCIKKLIPSSGGAFFYKLFCDVLFANIKLS